MNRLALSTPAAAAVAGALWWRNRHTRAVAGRRWRRSALPSRRIGPLHIRSEGSGDPVVVLLHGLVATGDIFGADFDALTDRYTLIVPDLLGFGRSLDENRSTFTVDDHLDALDTAMADLGLTSRPLILGAHSMGSAIAVAWAARLGPRVKAIVCWGAPVYPDVGSIESALADTGPMARLFAAGNRLAEVACQVNCRHRTLAGWFAAAASPSLPVPISRMASLHTWPAYRDAIDHVVAETNWTRLVATVTGNGTTLDLTWGSNDPIGNQNHARTFEGANLHNIAGADHHLPLTHPELCVGQLRRAAERIW